MVLTRAGCFHEWDSQGTSSLVIVGETSTQEKKELGRHAWVGYIYFLKSFAVQNRPPGNKIVTNILKKTMRSTGKAASFKTLCNIEPSEIILEKTPK